MGFTQYLPQTFPLKTVVIIFGLLTSSAGKLEIRRIDSPVDALVGHNTTLPCHFFGYKASYLDLSKVSVRWTLRTSEGEKPVYWFDGEGHIQNRPGSHIPDNELLGGDGSLHIPNVQFSDEGEYTCTVIVTPNKATSKVTLQVSAQPACTVSDSRVEINPGTERSVTCYVNDFYPQDVTIHWLKYSKSSSKKSKLDINTCTSIPVQNQDRTYNVTSVLSVKPLSTDEDGDVYSCIITHRSLIDGLTQNFTLSVEDIKSDNASIIVWITAGIVPTVIVLIMVALLCYYCIKVSPNVSEITKYNFLHMKESILKCDISGFRPKKLNIKLYLEKGSEEKREVCSWSSENPRPTSQENLTEEAMPLNPRNESKDLALYPVITSDKCFLFNCRCSIRLTPQFQIHNGAVLILEVNHAALKEPICRYKILVVKAIPEMDPIQANQKFYIIGDLMTLTCRIHSFYPKCIKVLWYKEMEKIALENIEAKEDGKGLYCVTCSVQRNVTEEDFEKTFRCKVVHQCKSSEFINWRLEKVVEPILDSIQTNIESYNVGDQLELKCKIHSFYPRHIKVTWCKEQEEIPSQTSEPEGDKTTGLHVISCIIYPVKTEDFQKTFTCKVEHSEKTYIAEWKLGNNTGNIRGTCSL